MNQDKSISFYINVALPYLIIIFFIISLYFRNLFFWWNGRTYIFADTAIYSLYLSTFAKNIDSLLTLKNNFLFWNRSYLAVGLPTLSIVDMGLFYPPNVIIALIARLFGNIMLTFPLYTISLYLHLAVSSIFIYKILCEFWNLEKTFAVFGALLWSFTGYNTEFLSAGSIMLSASYLPICFYTKLKNVREPNAKYFFAFYVFLALSFLVGYPISSIIIYLITSMCAFFSEICFSKFSLLDTVSFVKKELIGIFFVTTAIIAPLYFSVLIDLPYSTRTKLTLDGFLSNPAKLSNLTESFFPINTPFNATNNTNLVYLYFSLVGIVLFLTSQDKYKLLRKRENLILVVMGILGIVISLGKTAGLAAILYYVVPGFSFFRRLSVFSLVPGFGFCILVPQWFKSATTRVSQPDAVLSLLTAFLSGGFVFLLFTGLFNHANNPLLLSISQHLLIPVVIITLICIAFILKEYNPKYFIWLIFFALFFEASVNISSKVYINSNVDPKIIFQPNILTDTIIKDLDVGQRIDLLHTQHNYSVNHLNIEQTSGYLSLASDYGVKINEALNNVDYSKKNLRDILGVSLIAKKESDGEKNLTIKDVVEQNVNSPSFFAFNYDLLSWQPEPAGTRYFIYKRSTALPRVYVASKILEGRQSVDLLKEIESLDDPRGVFISGYDLIDKKLARSGNLNMLEYNRNYIRVESDLKAPAFIAASIGYFPGWWIKINGNWIDPIQTNWFMMGTYVPAGKNIIEILYIPYGLLIGILYIVVVLLMWLHFKRANFKVLK